MTGDVFEKDPLGAAFPDDAGDLGPEVAGIVGAPALARHAERLARISGSDDIHRAAPWAAVEAGNVVPERRVIQGRVFHPRHDNGRGEGVPLDVTHSSIFWNGEMDSEIETSSSSAEGKSKQASPELAVNRPCAIASGGR